MKKFFITLGCSLILLSSCNKETIKGAGAVISEKRTVPAFTEIQIHGDGEATVVYGLTQEVTVTGYENLLPVYETKMLGSVLQLQFKPNNYRIRNNNIKVRITVPSLSNLRINGSGNISAANFANGNTLATYINGSGNIVVKDSKYINASYIINGSGEITATTTEALEAAAEIHGSGNIRLKVANKLDANISGSGTIDYWGNPATVNTQVSGSGKINKQ